MHVVARLAHRLTAPSSVVPAGALRALCARSRRAIVPVGALALACAVAATAACERVRLPHEQPGPPGSGMRDPTVSGPSTMSIAQQTVLKNQGTPAMLETNGHGGRTWVYFRSAGSVFGESETAEAYHFDKDGLLVAQTTEVRKRVGK